MSDERALQLWNEARAAAMASGVYPADVVNSILMAKCVALLEELVAQGIKREPAPEPEQPKARFPGQRISGVPNGG